MKRKLVLGLCHFECYLLLVEISDSLVMLTNGWWRAVVRRKYRYVKLMVLGVQIPGEVNSVREEFKVVGGIRP